MKADSIRAMAKMLQKLPDITDQALRLRDREERIARGNFAACEFAMSLADIRDQKLYIIAGHSTWEQYCKEKWGFGRDYGYKIAAWGRALLREETEAETEREYRREMYTNGIHSKEKESAPPQEDMRGPLNVEKATKELRRLVLAEVRGLSLTALISVATRVYNEQGKPFPAIFQHIVSKTGGL